MISARSSALLFAALTGVVIGFQLALALGAPWGEYAMGGAFPGAYPRPMRFAAAGQGVALGLVGLIVLARAGLLLPSWRRTAAVLIWPVVLLLATSLILNLVTPSPMERLVWAPVAALLLLSSLRVALS